jgi:hypothetical protein
MSFILVRLFCWFLIGTRRSAEKFVLPEASDKDTAVYLLIWFSSIVCFVVTDRFVSTAYGRFSLLDLIGSRRVEIFLSVCLLD